MDVVRKPTENEFKETYIKKITDYVGITSTSSPNQTEVDWSIRQTISSQIETYYFIDDLGVKTHHETPNISRKCG